MPSDLLQLKPKNKPPKKIADYMATKIKGFVGERF